MKKSVLINQSGALGDIFCVAPIAKYYRDQGYLVFWPVREKYFNLVQDYFPYANALMIDQGRVFDSYEWDSGDWLRDDSIYMHTIKQHYDLFLDLADRGRTPQEIDGETFEETKYRIAKVPYERKHTLEFLVNWLNTKHLYKNMVTSKDFSNGYVVAHLESSHGDRAQIPEEETRPVVKIKPIGSYEIPDWIWVIIHSKAVYCVESSVHQFIDGIIDKYDMPELFLLSRSSLKPGESYTKSEHWNKKYMK